MGDGLTLKKDGRIGVTGLTAALKVKWHRTIPAGAKLGHAILSRNGGHWHISFLATLPEVDVPERECQPVGLDLGVSSLVALSNGKRVATPQWVRDAAAGLRRHQRRLARRTKGSNRWKKARRDLARYSRHIANQRRDFMHKLTTELARDYSHIAVEDLNILGLARGMLAKDVLNAGWGAFLEMLRYKAESAGGVVEAVDPRNTSQACAACGSLVPKKLSERRHDCPQCGYSADRDVNAAQNILLKSSFSGLGSSRRTQADLVLGLSLYEKLSALADRVITNTAALKT